MVNSQRVATHMTRHRHQKKCLRITQKNETCLGFWKNAFQGEDVHNLTIEERDDFMDDMDWSFKPSVFEAIQSSAQHLECWKQTNCLASAEYLSIYIYIHLFNYISNFLEVDVWPYYNWTNSTYNLCWHHKNWNLNLWVKISSQMAGQLDYIIFVS